MLQKAECMYTNCNVNVGTGSMLLLKFKIRHISKYRVAYLGVIPRKPLKPGIMRRIFKYGKKPGIIRKTPEIFLMTFSICVWAN